MVHWLQERVQKNMLQKRRQFSAISALGKLIRVSHPNMKFCLNSIYEL